MLTAIREGVTMTDIVHRMGFKAPLAKVYQALSTIEGLSGWWTRETSGASNIGELIHFRFVSPQGTELGKMEMEVTALNRDEHVAWLVKAGPADWLGTTITFDLSVQDGITILQFAHRNWAEATEFTAHCSTKWAIFLLSLRELVETGRGRPSPDDIKIDNWN